MDRIPETSLSSGKVLNTQGIVPSNRRKCKRLRRFVEKLVKGIRIGSIFFESKPKWKKGRGRGEKEKPLCKQRGLKRSGNKLLSRWKHYHRP
jgi:hypothetical protein